MPKTRGMKKAGGDDECAENSQSLRRPQRKNNVRLVTPAPKPESAPIKPSSAQTRKTRNGGFHHRLEWKMAHLRMPTTSTPKVDLYSKSRTVTKRDVDTAFGFDDSCIGEEKVGEYSALISPIAHTASPNSIIPKVWKVNPLTQRNTEIEPLSRPAECSVRERRSHRVRAQKVPDKEQLPKVLTKEAPPNVSNKEGLPNTSKIEGLPEVSSKEGLPEVSSKVKVGLPKVSSKVGLPKVTNKKVRRRASKKEVIPKALNKARQLKVSNKEELPKVSNNEDLSKVPNKERLSQFSALLGRYQDIDVAEQDGDLHVDPKRILKTYSSKKRIKTSEDREFCLDLNVLSKPYQLELEAPKIACLPKSKKAGPRGKTKNKEMDFDEETKRWLEEKNKEFEDILKIPLVIENSFTE